MERGRMRERGDLGVKKLEMGGRWRGLCSD